VTVADSMGVAVPELLLVLLLEEDGGVEEGDGCC